MLELTFNLMKEYRDMFPDDAETMTRAWFVSKRNRHTYPHRGLASPDTGCFTDRSNLCRVGHTPVVQYSQWYGFVSTFKLDHQNWKKLGERESICWSGVASIRHGI